MEMTFNFMIFYKKTDFLVMKIINRLKPNAEIIAAIKEARKISKTGKGFSTVDDLMKELNL